MASSRRESRLSAVQQRLGMQPSGNGLHVVLPVELGTRERSAPSGLDHGRVENHRVTDLRGVQVSETTH